MTPKPASRPPAPIRQGIDAADRRWILILARPFDADQQFEPPSIAETLTIEQCGFPRTYTLNDGLGPDRGSPALEQARLLDQRRDAERRGLPGFALAPPA